MIQVSWGTKGSDKAEVLPSIQSQRAPNADAPVVEDTTKIQEDVDAAFQDTVKRALAKRAADASSAPAKLTMDDENKIFRTRLVGFWMLTNAALVIAIQNINGWLNLNDPQLSLADVAQFEFDRRTKRDFYFEFILFATFGLTLIRFIGVRISSFL